MGSGSASFPTPDDIDAVIRYIPELEVADPAALYTWGGANEIAASVTAFPWVDYHHPVPTLVGELYGHRFVARNFHWQREGAPLIERFHQRGEIGEADLTDLVKLVTTHVRAERFITGHLADALDRGWILAILRRLTALAAVARDHGPDHLLLANRDGLNASDSA